MALPLNPCISERRKNALLPILSVAYNFGADAKVIVPKTIRTFMDLKLCYDNQVKFFKDFGQLHPINDIELINFPK